MVLMQFIDASVLQHANSLHAAVDRVTAPRNTRCCKGVAPDQEFGRRFETPAHIYAVYGSGLQTIRELMSKLERQALGTCTSVHVLDIDSMLASGRALHIFGQAMSPTVDSC